MEIIMLTKTINDYRKLKSQFPKVGKAAASLDKGGGTLVPEGFSVHSADNRKTAFTLAEVLITLGIIGIVAAMTLPTITAKTRKAEATARIKKFYSAMHQAIIMSEMNNGSCKEWQYETVNDYENPDSSGQSYEISEAFNKQYLIPYLKITGSEEREWITSTNQKLKGYALTFADGSVMNSKVGSCIDISFDVNGDKKPNQKGYDQFIFLICKGNQTIRKHCFTTYKPENNREDNLQNCKRNPYYCSALLEWDNWEFKDDYPYKL